MLPRGDEKYNFHFLLFASYRLPEIIVRHPIGEASGSLAKASTLLSIATSRQDCSRQNASHFQDKLGWKVDAICWSKARSLRESCIRAVTTERGSSTWPLDQGNRDHVHSNVTTTRSLVRSLGLRLLPRLLNLFPSVLPRLHNPVLHEPFRFVRVDRTIANGMHRRRAGNKKRSRNRS